MKCDSEIINSHFDAHLVSKNDFEMNSNRSAKIAKCVKNFVYLCKNRTFF